MMNALLGGRLAGDRTVRLVYMDEAGISNPKHEPYIVVAGVIVHGDQQLRQVEKHLDKLLRKHVRPEDREGFIFHAKEIFNGGKIIDRKDPYWSSEKRFAIAGDLAKIPAQFKLRIALGWVERKDCFLSEDSSQLENTMYGLAVAFLNCSTFVEKWMRNHAKNENCILIFEDNKDARKTIKAVQNFNQSKGLVVGDDHPALKVFPFKHIREDPLFQQKKQSSILEIADFCAFLWKRYLMEGDDSKFCRFLNPWRQQIVTLSKSRQ